jgi:hypothetical protein
MAIMMGISTKNPSLLIEYMGDIDSHLQNKVMFFKLNTMNEACVQAQFMENIGH